MSHEFPVRALLFATIETVPNYDDGELLAEVRLARMITIAPCKPYQSDPICTHKPKIYCGLIRMSSLYWIILPSHSLAPASFMVMRLSIGNI